MHVTLTDAGDALDFSKPMDMGAGGHGNHAMAPVKLTADKTTVPAGKVTFMVTNASSQTQHEMIVIPLASADAVPHFIAKENRVDEDDPKSLGEVSELDPGKSGKVTLKLKPGHYMLLCNVPGHYDAGMWARLEVK